MDQDPGRSEGQDETTSGGEGGQGVGRDADTPGIAADAPGGAVVGEFGLSRGLPGDADLGGDGDLGGGEDPLKTQVAGAVDAGGDVSES